MNFDEFEYYLRSISDNEFSERNREIQRGVLSVKSEMNARGLMNSSITLSKMGEFFEAEYQLRCGFIAEFIIAQIGKIEIDVSHDPVTRAKTLFQNLAMEEAKKFESIYDESTKQIRGSLTNTSIISQPKQSLMGVIDHCIKKNSLLVELEYKSCTNAMLKNGDILILKPSYKGIGIDLRALWKQIFKT